MPISSPSPETRPVRRLPRLMLRPTPLLISLLIHLVVLAAALVTWQSTPERKVIKPPQYIQAKLVKLKPETKKTVKKKQPKKIDLTKKRKPTAPVKKTQPAPQKPDNTKLQKKLKEEKQAEQKRKQAEAKQRQEQLEALQRQRLLDELEKSLKAEQDAVDAELMADEAQSYIEIISQKVEQNWNRPPSARNGMRCELLIQLVPTGRVVAVSILKSSGNQAFDRSAEQAVKKAEVFPELKEMSPEVFEKYYRRLNLVFNPQDLRQ